MIQCISIVLKSYDFFNQSNYTKFATTCVTICDGFKSCVIIYERFTTCVFQYAVFFDATKKRQYKCVERITALKSLVNEIDGKTLGTI